MDEDGIKSIGEAIKMERFYNSFQKAFLDLIFTSNQLLLLFSQDLKKEGITEPQFNVLRILRGQKGNPISAAEVGSRMLCRTSNVTRILDKLKEKGFIKTAPCSDNRRKNDIIISTKGLHFLKCTDHLPQNLFKKIESTISEEEAETLCSILDKMRQFIESE